MLARRKEIETRTNRRSDRLTRVELSDEQLGETGRTENVEGIVELAAPQVGIDQQGAITAGGEDRRQVGGGGRLPLGGARTGEDQAAERFLPGGGKGQVGAEYPVRLGGGAFGLADHDGLAAALGGGRFDARDPAEYRDAEGLLDIGCRVNTAVDVLEEESGPDAE